MKRLITCLLLTAIVGCGSQETEDTSAGQESGKPAAPTIDIFTAAGKGDLAAIKQHIAAGTDLNQLATDDQQSTPLIIAITFGQVATAKALIAAKADLNLQNKDGSTALSVAAFLGYGDIVQLLLEAGADGNIKNKDGATALDIVQIPWNDIKPLYDLVNSVLFQPLGIPMDYQRIQATRPKIAELIRQSGGKTGTPAGNLNAVKQPAATRAALRTWKDASGTFSIEAAFVRVADDQVVLKPADQEEISVPLVSLSVADRQYIEKQVAAPSKVDIFTAVVTGNLAAVKQHIETGTDLDQQTLDGQKKTPLMLASLFGRATIARTLIEADVKLDTKDKDGGTALSAAAFMCHPEIVEALLKKGADKNIQNKDGFTALQTVEGPFEDVKFIYDLIDGFLFKPAGTPLDYGRIKATRPKIAEMLR